MVLNYTSAFQNLTSGNISNAVVQTYDVTLGSYAWFLGGFATALMIYVKTQNVGLVSLWMILWMAVARYWLNYVGDAFFFAIVLLGITITFYRVWRG